jgi:hypothetical protein
MAMTSELFGPVQGVADGERMREDAADGVSQGSEFRADDTTQRGQSFPGYAAPVA